MNENTERDRHLKSGMEVRIKSKSGRAETVWCVALEERVKQKEKKRRAGNSQSVKSATARATAPQLKRSILLAWYLGAHSSHTIHECIPYDTL